MNKQLPKDGDTIVISRTQRFICCTKEFLEETYNEDVEKVMPTNEGIAWMLWSEDTVPPFIRCFKNKPKDKIFFQEVRYGTENDSTAVSGLDFQQCSFHNTKLTFCGETGKLKSIELIGE